MALEPQRPIESLLRASAERRREQAGDPFELHPANRRLLQGEVGRQFGRARGREHALLRRLFRLWPRLAWASALLVFLAGAAYLLLPLSNPATHGPMLARNEPAPAPVRTAPAPNAPPKGLAGSMQKPGPTTDAVASTTPLAPSAGQLDRSASVPSAGAPITISAPTQSLALVQGYERTGRLLAANSTSKALASQPIGTGAAAVVAAQLNPADSNQPRLSASSPAGVTGGAEASARGLGPGQTAQVVQHFVRAVTPPGTADAARGLSAAEFVLISFQVEQSGQTVRIIDGDGSVYTGSLELSSATVSLGTPTVKPLIQRQRALDDLASSPAGTPPAHATTYSFRAEGTNRSLNQKVVFVGQMASGSSAVPGVNSPTNLAPGSVGARIVGQAVVGEGQTIQINALPAGSR